MYYQAQRDSAAKGTARRDSALALGLSRKDAGTQAAVYHKHREVVYKVCIGICGDSRMAEDLTHDTFLSVFDTLGRKSSPVKNIRAYLVTTARHHCYRSLKSQVATESLERSAQTVVDKINVDPQLGYLQKAGYGAIRRAFARLTSRHSDILTLYSIDNLSYQEIAARKGISTNAVAQMIFRARRSLYRGLPDGRIL